MILSGFRQRQAGVIICHYSGMLHPGKFIFLEGFGKSFPIFNSVRVVVNSPLKDYIFPNWETFSVMKHFSIGKPLQGGNHFPVRNLFPDSWETFPSQETILSFGKNHSICLSCLLVVSFLGLWNQRFAQTTPSYSIHFMEQPHSDFPNSIGTIPWQVKPWNLGYPVTFASLN